jgi:hypothetical protein
MANELIRKLSDRLRGWLVAPINDDLLLNRRILNEVLTKLLEVKRTMITQEQVDAFIEQLNAKVAKIGDDLVAHISDLKAQVAAGQDLSPTLTKLEALGTKLQAVDDVIPEKPVPVTAPIEQAATEQSTTEQPAEQSTDAAAASGETSEPAS